MRFVLVSPPIAAFQFGSVLLKTRCWQPYSLAIAAAGLEKLGHDVTILDGHAMGWSIDETVSQTLALNADVLLYSSARHDAWELPTPDYKFIFEFFDKLKNRWPAGRPVVIEGTHGTLEPNRLFDNIPILTLVARHEPEPVLLTLFEKINEPAAWSEIGDLSYRLPGGRVIHNSDAKPFDDLDSLPMPAFHLLPMSKYREQGDPTVPFSIVVTSRGCPMPCGYCFKEMFGSKLRYRSIPNVIRELKLLVETFGVRRVFFHDQIFTLNRRRTHDLCESMIREGLPEKLTWRCQTRLNGMKNETLEIMRAAGCIEIQTGLESASPEIQEKILKLDVSDFLQFRRFGEQIGLKISPNNVIGLPGETLQTAMESLKFYHRLGIPYAPNFHFPFPTTPFYKNARESGEIANDSFELIAEKAGLVGNHLTTTDLQTILKSCEKWNRRLRWKNRIYQMFGRTYGSLVSERERGARDPRMQQK
ncbi:MAG: B12-binding domain-containing radical SAM protein [Planctomycetota bacterium]